MTLASAGDAALPGAASPDMSLGVEGFTYADLYIPSRLSALDEAFRAWFASVAPDLHIRFEAYRACAGEGMSPVDKSDALLAAAPFLGRFVARLFGVEQET